MKRAMRVGFASGVLLLALSADLCFADAPPIMLNIGFISGQQYLAMDERSKRGYAMGLIDGMFIAPIFGAPQSKLDRFGKCTGGMTDEQVAAILTKYLREHPAHWHESAHTQMYAALLEACP
jgi:hypothetical protein